MSDEDDVIFAAVVVIVGAVVIYCVLFLEIHCVLFLEIEDYKRLPELWYIESR